MYATVRRYEGVANPREVERQVKEGFLPLIKAVPGFVAFCWVDAGGSVVVSTSIFETQAGAEESNRRAADFVRQKLAPLLPNPPQISAGEAIAYQAG